MQNSVVPLQATQARAVLCLPQKACQDHHTATERERETGTSDNTSKGEREEECRGVAVVHRVPCLAICHCEEDGGRYGWNNREGTHSKHCEIPASIFFGHGCMRVSGHELDTEAA